MIISKKKIKKNKNRRNQAKTGHPQFLPRILTSHSEWFSSSFRKALGGTKDLGVHLVWRKPFCNAQGIIISPWATWAISLHLSHVLPSAPHSPIPFLGPVNSGKWFQSGHFLENPYRGRKLIPWSFLPRCPGWFLHLSKSHPIQESKVIITAEIEEWGVPNDHSFLCPQATCSSSACFGACRLGERAPPLPLRGDRTLIRKAPWTFHPWT